MPEMGRRRRIVAQRSEILGITEREDRPVRVDRPKSPGRQLVAAMATIGWSESEELAESKTRAAPNEKTPPP